MHELNVTLKGSSQLLHEIPRSLHFSKVMSLKTQFFNKARDKSQSINVHSANLQEEKTAFEKSHFINVQSSK